MRKLSGVDIGTKVRLIAVAGLIGLAVGVPIFVLLGFSGSFLFVQPLSIGICGGLGIMCWRLYFPIHSAQIASAAAVSGGVVLVIAMLFFMPRLVGFLLPSILIIDVVVGFLAWRLRDRLGLEVFFEPRQ